MSLVDLFKAPVLKFMPFRFAVLTFQPASEFTAAAAAASNCEPSGCHTPQYSLCHAHRSTRKGIEIVLRCEREVNRNPPEPAKALFALLPPGLRGRSQDAGKTRDD